MKLKSINILTTLLAALLLSACYQDQVETSYSSSTPGYNSPRMAMKNRPREPNRFVNENSAFRSRTPEQIPVILNDPFAAGVGTPQAFQINPASGIGLPYGVPAAQQPINNNPYGALRNAENQVIRSNVLIQNQAPVYQQPTFGNNYYRPYGR